jgi:hypothetical protein
MKAIAIGPVRAVREQGECTLSIPMVLQHPEWAGTEAGEDKLDETKEATMLLIEASLKELGKKPRDFSVDADWKTDDFVLVSLTCNDECEANDIAEALKPKLAQLPDVELTNKMPPAPSHPAR